MVRGSSFGSLNHMQGSTINRQQSIVAETNALIVLALSGAQPTLVGAGVEWVSSD
jgi:hypothetical protein